MNQKAPGSIPGGDKKFFHFVFFLKFKILNFLCQPAILKHYMLETIICTSGNSTSCKSQIGLLSDLVKWLG